MKKSNCEILESVKTKLGNTKSSKAKASKNKFGNVKPRMTYSEKTKSVWVDQARKDQVK